jgi:hypothetical protein
VEGFRSRDPNVPKPEAADAADSAQTFHLLAERYARTLYPATLIIACGLMGSGKSTCARGLKEFADIEILSSDRVRKELAGLEPSATRHVPFRTGIYSSMLPTWTFRGASKLWPRPPNRVSEHSSSILILTGRNW